jgi:hypothetical protein
MKTQIEAIEERALIPELRMNNSDYLGDSVDLESGKKIKQSLHFQSRFQKA